MLDWIISFFTVFCPDISYPGQPVTIAPNLPPGRRAAGRPAFVFRSICKKASVTCPKGKAKAYEKLLRGKGIPAGAIPAEIRHLEYCGFRFDVPEDGGAITFRIWFDEGILPEIRPAERERQHRLLLDRPVMEFYQAGMQVPGKNLVPCVVFLPESF